MKNYNKIFFDKINSLQGKSRWLDAFGRAGAEWVIVAMCGWFAVEVIVNFWPDLHAAFIQLLFFAGIWVVAWAIDVGIALLVRKPRPQISEPASHQLFHPVMGWKSFPSDHSMTAFLIFFFALIFSLPGAWALLILALWVVWGRVYSGVHYPVDILGGISIAAFVAVWTKLFFF